MKKYNKPEIETLALDMVDVIETSGAEGTMAELQKSEYYTGQVYAQTINESIENMSNTWSW